MPDDHVPDDRDERRHTPGDDALWGESWYFDFAADDGSLGGYVRLGLDPGARVAWYWAYLVGRDRPMVAVRDHEAPLPRGDGLEVRTSGLWSELHCETPMDHWSIGLEAFGVAFDDPAEAYRGERGDRVALGLDLEWEAAGPAYGYPGVTRYEQACRVHGEILVGDERIAFDGTGERDHSWGRRDWWSFPWTWTSGWLDDGTAFHGVRVGGADAAGHDGADAAYQTGFTLPPGASTTEAVGRVAIEAELGAEGLPVRGRHRIGDLELEVTPLAHAPVLLTAADGRVSRFPRALCRYRTPDGRTGHGWTEWLQPP